MASMARVKNEPQVSALETADEGSAIHHAGDILKTSGNLDVIERRVDEWGTCSIRALCELLKRIWQAITPFRMEPSAMH